MALPSLVTTRTKAGTFASSDGLSDIACGSGGNRVALMVAVNYRDNTFYPGDATLGGVTMSKGAAAYNGNLGSYLTPYWLGRASMPSGTQPLVVDLSSAGGLGKLYFLLAIYDNCSADPVAPTINASQSFNGPNVAVATASGRLVACLGFLPSGYTITPQDSAVLRALTDAAAAGTCFLMDEPATSSIVSINGSVSGLTFTPGWGMFGWDLQPTVSAATAITLSGPSSGTVGSPSSAFTVGLDGTPSGSITVNLTDGGAGGTFSPSTVVLSPGTLTATFTYTPSATGAVTLSTSNGSGLTEASAGYTGNATLPSYSTQPSNQSAVAGGTVSFSVVVTGSPTPTGKWQRNAAGAGSWVDMVNGGGVTGATAATLSITPVTVTGGSFNNTDQFRYVASNAAGTVNSNPATLTVSAAGDTTNPSWGGGAALGHANVTSTSARGTWPAATDNVAIAFYEHSFNNGSTWTNVGNVLFRDFSGLTPGQTVQQRVRPVDTSGNRGPELTDAFTTVTTTITIGPMSSGSGTVWPNGTAISLSWFPGGRVGSFAGITLVERTATISGTNGSVTVTGLPAGAGLMLAAKLNTSAVDDQPYYQAGTVA